MSSLESDQIEKSSFENDQVLVNVTKKPACQVEFDIRVKPEAVKASYQAALRKVTKEVSIPGFRKGKAPESFIKDQYQKFIEQEFVELTLETAFNEALNLTSIHVLKDGSVKRPVVKECSKEKGAHFILEFECRPIVPSINLNDLHIERILPTSITDKDRENAKNNLLLQFASYDPVEDRPAQEGDFANLTITILDESPRNLIENQRVRLSDTNLPSWLLKKLIGLNPEEEINGMTEQGPDESSANFVSLPFRAVIDALWIGNLPEFDDALAQRVGLKSVEELNEKIDERLNQQAKEDASKIELNALHSQLLQKYPFDIPNSYLEDAVDKDLANYFYHSGIVEDDYTPSKYEELRKKIEANTKQNMQLYLILSKAAQDFSIVVDQADVSEELSHQIMLMQSGRGDVNLSEDRTKLYGQLEHLALRRKTDAFLIERASQNG